MNTRYDDYLVPYYLVIIFCFCLKSTQKKLIYSLGAIMVALLVAVVVLASFLGMKKSDSQDVKLTICTTKACIFAGNLFS